MAEKDRQREAEKQRYKLELDAKFEEVEIICTVT
jgi:hypothetical protein